MVRFKIKRSKAERRFAASHNWPEANRFLCSEGLSLISESDENIHVGRG
jgi:hypothetical protein